MAQPRKKMKNAVNKKPRWVGDISVSNPILGVVYNIYECRECILTHEEDIKRPRKRKVAIPGLKKKKIATVCPEHQSLLLIKYKKCNCGLEWWGHYLKTSSTCKDCGSYADEVNGSTWRYYRRGEYYKTTKEDLTDQERHDCKFRSHCLECTFENGAKKSIACKDCPYYQPRRL